MLRYGVDYRLIWQDTEGNYYDDNGNPVDSEGNPLDMDGNPIVGDSDSPVVGDTDIVQSPVVGDSAEPVVTAIGVSDIEACTMQITHRLDGLSDGLGTLQERVDMIALTCLVLLIAACGAVFSYIFYAVARKFSE